MTEPIVFHHDGRVSLSGWPVGRWSKTADGTYRYRCLNCAFTAVRVQRNMLPPPIRIHNRDPHDPTTTPPTLEGI